MSEQYLVSKETLLELIESAEKLTALENGGVDNWQWYDESMSNYFKQYEDENGEPDKNELFESMLEGYGEKVENVKNGGKHIDDRLLELEVENGLRDMGW